MLFRKPGTGGELLVRLKGHVDASSPQEIKAILQDAPGATVVLDFTHARDVDYCALAAVAAMLAKMDTCVALRGLSKQHLRMLTYFGLDPGRFGIAPRSDGP